MFHFNRPLAIYHYILAGVLAAGIPMLAGNIIYRSAPGACYDSPCALPLMLIVTPPYAVPVLVAIFALNRRLRTPFPDGFLPFVLLSGLVGQIGVSAYSYSMASDSIRRIFFYEVLFFPLGLAVIGCVGAVFWISAYGLARITSETR